MSVWMMRAMVGCNYLMAMSVMALSGAPPMQKLAALGVMLLLGWVLDVRWVLDKLPLAWRRDPQNERLLMIYVRGSVAALAGARICCL